MENCVFIDGGSHNGCSTRKFRNSFAKSSDFRVHCFEPDPRFADCYTDLDVTFHPRAIWIEDGPCEFFVSHSNYSDGGTLLRTKISGQLDKDRPIVVEGIDFPKWVRQSFEIGDTIWLKLDIEGAEYVVLQEMIDQGVIGMIDRLFIEFHWDRIGMDLRSHDQLEQQLRRFGIPIEFWDALYDNPGSVDLRED